MTPADIYGWDVAIKGDTFVVGAPGYEGKEVGLIEGWMWAGRGRAMVMAREDSSSPSSWYRQAILSPNIAEDNADFGTSVDIAGEVLPRLKHVSFFSLVVLCQLSTAFAQSDTFSVSATLNVKECECLIAVGYVLSLFYIHNAEVLYCLTRLSNACNQTHQGLAR